MKSNNKWLLWSLGGISFLAVIAGAYYLMQGKKDSVENQDNKNLGDGVTNTPPIPSPIPSPTPSPTPSPNPTSKPKETSSNTSSTSNTNAPTQTNTNATPPYNLQTPQKVPTDFETLEQVNAFLAWLYQKDRVFFEQMQLPRVEMHIAKVFYQTIYGNPYAVAWAKYGRDYYTENANNLGLLMRTVTGATKIDGGDSVFWDSSNISNEKRGRIRMWTNGKLQANLVIANGKESDTWVSFGGWYKIGDKYHLMIDGVNYIVNVFNLTNAFWSILKKANIYNSSTNSYRFSADGINEEKKFSITTDESFLQDTLL
jgi:hypothetical protein